MPAACLRATTADGRICPLHACEACGGPNADGDGLDATAGASSSLLLRCARCPRALHEACLARVGGARLLDDRRFLCDQHAVRDAAAPTSQVERAAMRAGDVGLAFRQLRVPQTPREFEVPAALLTQAGRAHKPPAERPPPFVHLKRSEYVAKRPKHTGKGDCMPCSCAAAEVANAPNGGGGAEPSGRCDSDCLCRVLFTTCSKLCACGQMCGNVPFHRRRGPKLKPVKTEKCGWGVRAAEDIKEGSFIIEYVGEVIDDATCEQRLWDLKAQKAQDFYMVEINRDMVIDATFKGNLSRLINHSCRPNCELQKWHIDGEMRIGIHAITDILKGSTLSYNYQFVQFGSERMDCHCGMEGCRGILSANTKKDYQNDVHRELFLATSQQPFRAEGIADRDGQMPSRSKILSSISLCGKRVRVWWPLDQAFYCGNVQCYNVVTKKHTILYEDGTTEELNLSKEDWKYEEVSKLAIARMKRAARRQACELLGSRINIWSTELHRYLTAEVKDFKSAKHYQVVYDNGMVASIDLAKERWQHAAD
eukprot:SM000012S25446  [mRNA]  locus=s12:1163763:1167737:- [translate_table: standard]